MPKMSTVIMVAPMVANVDLTQYAVLYVDDEEYSLKYFHRHFAKIFRVLTATNAHDAFGLFMEHQDQLAVVMSDQQMPGEKGVDLLERTVALNHRVKRILVTAYADIDVAINAVNRGAIFQYITKPWEQDKLEEILVTAVRLYAAQRQQERVLLSKMDELHDRFYENRLLGLSNFLAGLNHHLRNSMVAIKTFLDLTPAKLKAENIEIGSLQNSAYWVELYNTALSYVGRINGLILELNAIVESDCLPHTDPIDLESMLVKLEHEYCAAALKKGITISSAVEAELPRLLVSAGPFRRLFALLIEDEIQNLPRGSRITITARRSGGNRVASDEVQVTVQDNGASVSREQLRTIFDPFSVRSGSPDQFGMNLIQCFLIVHQHRGIIEADNNDQGGVTYTLTLPTSPSSATTDGRRQMLLCSMFDEMVNRRVLPER